MMIYRYLPAVFLFLAATCALAAQAALAPPQRLLLDEQSGTLAYTATIGGKPASAQFQRFRLDIAFDPEAPETGHASLTVETRAAQEAYANIASQLKITPWLDLARLEEARFVARRFAPLGGNRYEAHGTLSLGAVSFPVGVTFELVRYDASGAEIRGSTMVNSLLLGMPQKESAGGASGNVPVKFRAIAEKRRAL